MQKTKRETFGGRLFHAFPPPKFLAMSAIGLDISDTCIRFVELTRDRHGFKLGKFGSHPLPNGAVIGGKIEQPDKLAQVFQELRKEQDLHFVRVSLPEEHAYLFQTSVAATLTSAKELRSAIEFQLEEHVPLPSHKAVFDTEIIDRHGDELHVNVAVYSEDIVRPYVETLREAGLVPLSFEIESSALARAVVSDNQDSYMIVDFGRSRTGIAIVRKGTVRFTSTVSVGGEMLSNSIRELTNISDEEIVTLKNEKGITKMNEDERLVAAMVKILATLKHDIQRHADYWNTRVHKNKHPQDIKGIILCGGSSNLAGLSEYLSFDPNIPVTVANAWTNIFSFDECIPPISRQASLSYAVALGLALRI